VTTFAPQSS